VTVDELVTRLGLSPHPEGGFFRETYRAPLVVEGPRGPRPACTAMVYLLPAGAHAAFHRVHADELWHFYAGAPLRLYRLGLDEVTLDGMQPQALVPSGIWQAAETLGAFSLVGCTVAPGFDFADWELGRRSLLGGAYPDQAVLIDRLAGD
jgi:predicted cupin superfamily sugar epimerase